MTRQRRRSRTVYVGDQRWKFERSAALRDCYGDCNYELRRIRVAAGLCGVDLLDTICHELIHARWPDLSEDAVSEFSETLSGLLHAEGFRQPEDDDE